MTLFALRARDDLLAVRFAVGSNGHRCWPCCRAAAMCRTSSLRRLLGRTRALVLATLNQPLSTTALAAATELSPAGVSRHLLALRDAGLVSATRHGHEVRYRRTELGSALLHARRDWHGHAGEISMGQN